jgi:diguanylate cyclase (GGDEF)-like protein/PAS domain S-box-containing protein
VGKDGENMLNAVRYALYMLSEEKEDNGNVLYANTEFCNLTGYTIEDIENKKVNQNILIPDKIRDEYFERVKQMLSTDGAAYLEHPIVKKNGEVIYVYCYGESLGYNDDFRKSVSRILISDISAKEKIRIEVEKVRKRYEMSSKNILRQREFIESLISKTNGAMISMIYEPGNERIVYCTKSTKKLFKVNSTDDFLSGSVTIFDFVSQSDNEKLREIIAQCLKTKSASKDDIRFVIGNVERWFEVNCTYIDDAENDNIVGLLMVDVTKYKYNDVGVALQNKFFSLLSESTKDVMLAYDCENDTMIAFTVVDGKRNIKRKSENFKQDILSSEYVYNDDKKLIIDTIENIVGTTEPVRIEYRYRNNKKDKIYRWIAMTLVSVEYEENGGFDVIGKCSDVSDEVEKRQDFIKKSQIDALTGLYNAGTVKNLISTFINNSTQQENALHALLIIDVDNFKDVNDTLGHLCGDNVLSEIGKDIMNVFSPNENISGRIGGDEFVVFMPDCTSKVFVEESAGKICESLKKHVKGDGSERTVDISASVGISYYEQKGETYTQLFENADTALYFKKSTGKSGYSVFDGKMKNSDIVYKSERRP